MVKCYQAKLDAVFAALSDATRRGMLTRLADGETSVSELAAPCSMSLPAVTKHLGVLEAAGLIVRHKEGRVCRCCLRAKPMKSADEWLGQYRRFWEGRFDALAAFLTDEEKENEE